MAACDQSNCLGDGACTNPRCPRHGLGGEMERRDSIPVEATVLPAKRVTVDQYDAIISGLSLGIKAAAGMDGPKW
jgi:hypothetical protein